MMERDTTERQEATPTEGMVNKMADPFCDAFSDCNSDFTAYTIPEQEEINEDLRERYEIYHVSDDDVPLKFEDAIQLRQQEQRTYFTHHEMFHRWVHVLDYEWNNPNAAGRYSASSDWIRHDHYMMSLLQFIFLEAEPYNQQSAADTEKRAHQAMVILLNQDVLNERDIGVVVRVVHQRSRLPNIGIVEASKTLVEEHGPINRVISDDSVDASSEELGHTVPLSAFAANSRSEAEFADERGSALHKPLVTDTPSSNNDTLRQDKDEVKRKIKDWQERVSGSTDQSVLDAAISVNALEEDLKRLQKEIEDKTLREADYEQQLSGAALKFLELGELILSVQKEQQASLAQQESEREDLIRRHVEELKEMQLAAAQEKKDFEEENKEMKDTMTKLRAKVVELEKQIEFWRERDSKHVAEGNQHQEKFESRNSSTTIMEQKSAEIQHEVVKISYVRQRLGEKMGTLEHSITAKLRKDMMQLQTEKRRFMEKNKKLQLEMQNVRNQADTWRRKADQLQEEKKVGRWKRM